MIFFYALVLVATLLMCTGGVLFFIAEVWAAFTVDAPFVPIPNGIDDKILEYLRLESNSILYDLGCGDARVLKVTTERYLNIKAVGIEKGFVPYLLAKFNTRKNKNIEIKRGDIFTCNTKDATHIFVYLYPQVLEKLMPILEKNCRPGTRIVSCDFEDKNRTYDEIIPLESLNAERGKRLVIYTL